MIIRRLEGTQLLITQPDHAALAGQIMEYWTAGTLDRSPRRSEILLAIYEHDNGWSEPDAAPIVDSGGAILDFVHAPDDVRSGVWPRGVERLAHTPYAAALVAQHSLHIYERYRARAEWQPFFERMASLRDRHLRRASGTEHELLEDYRFVRVADLMSLTFCHGWRDVQEDGFGFSMRCDDGVLIVTPDPFGGKAVPIEITGVEIANNVFASAEEALRTVSTAPNRTLVGEVRGVFTD